MLIPGRMVLNGAVGEILESFGRTKLFIESGLTADDLREFDGVTKIKQHGQEFELTLADPAVGHQIFATATENGYILEFRPQLPTLDEIFCLKACEADA